MLLSSAKTRPSHRTRHARMQYAMDNQRRDANGVLTKAPPLPPTERELQLCAMHSSKGNKRPRMPRVEYSSEFKMALLFHESDCVEHYMLGTGPGGQAVNRRLQSCVLRHVPTGLSVRAHHHRSLYGNRRMARAMMNLKVEERTLGSKSRLGHARVMSKLRSDAKRAERERLLEEGKARLEHAAIARDYCAFLTEQGCLTEAATHCWLPVQATGVQRVCADAEACNAACRDLVSTLCRDSKQPKLREFHDRGCGRWWELCALACGADRVSLALEDPPCRVEPPPWFQFLFPSHGDRPLTKSDTEQFDVRLARPPKPLRKKAASGAKLSLDEQEHVARRKTIRDNVHRSLQVFVECFGLRLVTTENGKGAATVTIERDGLNWIELRGRLAEPAGGALWWWVHRSLQQLKIDGLRDAVRACVEREAADDGTQSRASCERVGAACKLLARRLGDRCGPGCG